MSKRLKIVFNLLLLASVLIAAGCSGNPQTNQPAAPTTDLNAVRTVAAQTVVAEMTAQAFLNPTATTAPPTVEPTEAPTALPSPTVLIPTQALGIPTATRRPAGGGGGGYAPAPTATPRNATDQAQLLSTTPDDGVVFNPNEDFDAKWEFKNIGKRKWTTEFYIRSLGGNMGPDEGTIMMIPSEVGRGDTVEFVMDMTAPKSPGRYTSYWTLVNDNAEEFYHFYVTIVVK